MVIESDIPAGDAFVHVRHPWFGWLHFILTKDEAKRLGLALVAQVEAPAPDTSGRA